MSTRYRKSFKAGPFRVTSKSGSSYSAGVKGARVTKRADGVMITSRHTLAGLVPGCWM